MLQHYTWMQALFKLCFGVEILPNNHPSAEYLAAEAVQAPHDDARLAYRPFSTCWHYCGLETACTLSAICQADKR